ncbi:MAG: hypothetical protein EPO32_02860 [Anaerolineae bacterium]|nr:MAG: hypothetical protein EPO32_02860 [Anaerolineae bacterium]
MTHQNALFAGLVVDEFDRPVDTAHVGDEAMYVVDDRGFRRHIPAAQVDRAVLGWMSKMIEGHEDILSEQAAKMLGTEDIFSKAMLESQFRNIDEQLEKVIELGIPEESRAFLGMTGFKVRINLHGDVLEVIQPGADGRTEEE